MLSLSLVLYLLFPCLSQSLQPRTLFQRATAEWKRAGDDGWGTKAKNAAANCSLGDVIVPLVRDSALRQTLANAGVYAGVEYSVEELNLPNGRSVSTLQDIAIDEKLGSTALVKPRYSLKPFLERNDWPVQVILSDVPLWVSRSTYEAGTAVGTLAFSLFSFTLATIASFFIQFVSVPSPSMLPALTPGDVVLVTRTIPIGPFAPRPGDVLFFKSPPALEKAVQSIMDQNENVQAVDGKQKLIKRVVAVPGEDVGVKNSNPYVKISPTSYRFDITGAYSASDIFPASSWDRPPTTLAKDEYFVAGDNGYRSVDSRVWGPLSSRYIVGSARWVVWPIEDVGPIKGGEIKEVEIWREE